MSPSACPAYAWTWPHGVNVGNGRDRSKRTGG